MRNVTLLFVFLFIKSFGQHIPELTTEKKNVALKTLDIKVEIINNIAVTTFDMRFYNPNNRILEGEFVFPLQENQSVTRFALDINGNLREAVVIEKEKARVAFESTVRQRIDPALLEKTKGNNYKTRIYPIPAKGYKRVVLAYQEELSLQTNDYWYRLPMHFKKQLQHFALSIQIANLDKKPSLQSNFLKGFSFDAKSNTYKLKINKKKFKTTNGIVVKIPMKRNDTRLVTSNNYFYFNTLLNIVPRKKEKAKKITIFWDNSLSQKNRQLVSEINLLNAYFKELQNVDVRLITFNAFASKPINFKIKNGNWNSLKTTLENQTYDGGSSFEFLKKHNDNSDEYLLFSDGLNTFSELKFNTFKKTTYTINSAVSANHFALKNLANVTGGSYINLQESNTKKALTKLQRVNLQFLGTNLSEEIDTYPKKGTLVFENFSLVGKNIPNKNVELYFGYGKEIIKKVTLNLNQSFYNSNIIKKLWATQKINFLSKNKEDNENEIINISKEYQVISPFTSMLILDRVEDYVTHNIEPPKELRSEFKRLISLKKDNKKEQLNKLQQRLFSEYDDFLAWYNRNKNITRTASNLQNNNRVVENSTSIQNNDSLRVGAVLKTGTVSDESGPLPSVNVLIKGTSIGTETDYDGKYKINAMNGDVLVFSFVGMETLEKIVGSSNTMNVELNADNNILDEIVVTGYGAQEETANNSEEISNNLAGKVAGISVASSSSIQIRGASSIQNANNPLYILDGKIVTNIAHLNPKNIASLYVLKGEQGTKLYGARATNGIIVITSKKGARKNANDIANFEEMVKNKLEFKAWQPNAPYLKELELINDTALMYKKYVALRSKYETSISYFIDVADIFFRRNKPKIATKILSNVAEIDLDNYELLRALAYKLEEYKQYEKAIHIYKEVLQLRPEDIQSYRDLALAYAMNNKPQQSLDLFNKIIGGELLLKDESRRYKGIETISFLERNRLLQNKKLNTSKIITKKVATPLDIRVVIDWNHNDTDIDLWVIDPNNEKCYYKHKKTKIGGLLSNDMTAGFGPEQFTLKKAIQGNYKIKAKYYSDSQQKISGPTFLKVSIFKNYGRTNEEKTIKLVRLTEKNDVIDLGMIQF